MAPQMLPSSFSIGWVFEWLIFSSLSFYWLIIIVSTWNPLLFFSCCYWVLFILSSYRVNFCCSSLTVPACGPHHCFCFLISSADMCINAENGILFCSLVRYAFVTSRPTLINPDSFLELDTCDFVLDTADFFFALSSFSAVAWANTHAVASQIITFLLCWFGWAERVLINY